MLLAGRSHHSILVNNATEYTKRIDLPTPNKGSEDNTMRSKYFMRIGQREKSWLHSK